MWCYDAGGDVFAVHCTPCSSVVICGLLPAGVVTDVGKFQKRPPWKTMFLYKQAVFVYSIYIYIMLYNINR